MTALNTLPTTLQDMYAKLLRALELSHCYREALFILQYVLWSDTPPTFSEMIDAVAVRLDESPMFQVENRLFDLMDVVVQCSSLLSVVIAPYHAFHQRNDRTEIHLAHSSVKEYLKSQHLVRPFDRLLSQVHASAIIAKTCLAYNINFFDRTSTSLDEIRESGFPFLRSPHFWTKHVSVIQATDDDVVRLVLHHYRQYLAMQGFPNFLNLSLAQSYKFCTSHDKLHPLIHACFWGLDSVARCFLETDADANLFGEIDSPLHVASYEGHQNLVKLLLDRGAVADGNVTHCTQTKLFPLLGASINGHIEIVQILLQHGASVDSRDDGGRTAIELAAANGDLRVVQCLLDHTACEPYALVPDVYERAIFEATRESKEEVVWLLAQNVTYDIRGSHILAKSLELAVEYMNLNMVRAILQTGAFNYTCLNPAAVMATKAGSIAILEILLDHGATSNECRHTQDTPLLPHDQTPDLLLFAMRRVPLNRMLVKTLWSKGANFDAQTSSIEFKKTLRHLWWYDEIALLIWLSHMGVDVPIQNDKAWHVPDEQDRSELARFLTEENERDDIAELALMLYKQGETQNPLGLAQMLWLRGVTQPPRPSSTDNNVGPLYPNVALKSAFETDPFRLG